MSQVRKSTYNNHDTLVHQVKQATYRLFWMVVTLFFHFLTSSSENWAKMFKGVTTMLMNRCYQVIDQPVVDDQ